MIILKENKGTTLLELVVVVSVLGLMLAVGGPNLMKWMERGREREAAYELASALRLARAQALELGNRTGIKLSIGGETDLDGDGGDEDYILFVDSDPTDDNDYTAGEQVIYNKKWGRGACIDSSSGGAIVVYKPSGLLRQGDTTIDIGDYDVIIQPNTGRVMVDEN